MDPLTPLAPFTAAPTQRPPVAPSQPAAGTEDPTPPDRVTLSAGPAHPKAAEAPPKIHVAVHWHMHQPIYWPGEDILQTSRNPQNTDDPVGHVTWPDRVGGYTHYLADAVQMNSNLPHAGAQISWSGSLTENVDTLARNGVGFGPEWAGRYRDAAGWRTAQGNPRLDFVGFGYHHPLMPLTTTGNPEDDRDTELQIRMHREMLEKTFGTPPSKGFFPPEQAFSERMLPVLKETGHEWVLVDNLHVERATRDYPWSEREKVQPPNPAEQTNPSQPGYEFLHCEQNSTNPVSGLGLRPAFAAHVDPRTGEETRMVVVPSERSLGYDDSYGDRSPIPRLEQIEKFNTDPAHPVLVVLAHDGDNFGCSGSRYYNETMRWAQQNPDKVEFTTVQDYLDRFPPDPNRVLHVEDGSWTGADMGNQEFGKWLGKPYHEGRIDHVRGYSPDRNSWAVLVAAENRVMTADRLRPPSSLQGIQSGEGSATEKAWHYFLQGQTSCYEYWDGKNEWDNKPTLAANLAVEQADAVIAQEARDPVGPTLFVPQRTPYNPGGRDDENPVPPASDDFTVWTLAYDVSGLKRVELKWRIDPSKARDSKADEMYDGDWNTQDMQGRQTETRTSVQPRYKAEEYSARVEGQKDCLIQYYVEAEDGAGNLTRSPIQHVRIA